VQCKFHPDRPVRARGLCNACYVRHRKRGTLSEHTYKKGVPAAWLATFLAAGTETDDCVLWPYGKDKGYGVIFWNGRCQRVTRVLMERAGIDLAGREACHSCDNPTCVNPRHLFAGTHHENMTDATVKGIMRKKLTADDVRAIRAMKGTMLQREIGAMFGVNQTVVGDIHRRVKWRHVE